VLKVRVRIPVNDGAAAVSAEALPRIRLAEPFEALRDASDEMLEVSGARPRIFLATLGTPAEFTPRAAFSKNFFESGGIEAIGEFEAAVSDVQALAAAFKLSAAPLVCLCSSDKIYEKDAEAASRVLKAAGAKHLYLAGRPEDREAALRAAGVESFIYDGCDALATLQAAYDILGS
jgi:methylmalonyl-CoA mutase